MRYTYFFHSFKACRPTPGHDNVVGNRRTDLVVDVLLDAGEESEEERQLDVLVAVNGGGEGSVGCVFVVWF